MLYLSLKSVANFKRLTDKSLKKTMPWKIPKKVDETKHTKLIHSKKKLFMEQQTQFESEQANKLIDDDSLFI